MSARPAAGWTPPSAMFAPPLNVAGITVASMGHPRLDVEAGRRWLRGLVPEFLSLRSKTGEP